MLKRQLESTHAQEGRLLKVSQMQISLHKDLERRSARPTRLNVKMRGYQLMADDVSEQEPTTVEEALRST